MRCLRAAALIAVAGFTTACLAGDSYAGSSKDRAALQKTSEAIRTAFARGDIPAIMAYHHPDVAKALSYNKILHGRDAVRGDLMVTFAAFQLEFVDHTVESLFVQGDTAVEQSTFAIKGTPKNEGGEPFLFRGRSMVVYVRYGKSPTGWASIRELIQPAP